MNARWVAVAVPFLAFALEGGSATCLAAAPSSSAVPVPAMVSPGSDSRSEDAKPVLDQRAIFEILCGGAAASSPRLHEHLWRVAGSLASRGWTPPQVTIRVVIHAAPR